MYNEEERVNRGPESMPYQKVPIRFSPGALIPRGSSYTSAEFVTKTKQSTPIKRTATFVTTLVVVVSVTYGFMSAGPELIGLPQTASATLAPQVFLNKSSSENRAVLGYGAEPLLSQPDFFSQTKTSFLSNRVSFIEADLSAMKLHYYKDGELIYEAKIISKGKEGSWWETPAGLYKVELKKENHFSSFGNVYQPWSMVFQGNFFIHGWPEYPDKTPVAAGYSGGCIRLETKDAAELYSLVDVDTPILVFERDFGSDGFLYEQKVPELTTNHYLVSDIKNNTILAGENIDDILPVASLTKLMTALVAAEYINLDNSVRISSEKYVTTLIPRLEGKYRASMYSLLQLLLVESSNEAAEVIASVTGRDNFIAYMNKKAISLGLNDTVFTDPSGLDEGNVSTVNDLLQLVRYINNNRSFILELTHNANLETAYINGEFGELDNFNLIDDVDNFIGGKVGETLAAGQTSISLHDIEVNGEKRLIAIILLKSEARNEDIKSLLSYIAERYEN